MENSAMKTVKFKDWICLVKIGKYPSGKNLIELIDAEEGTPVATATLNITDFPVKKREVAIKNYSENEGILDVLINAGIIKRPSGQISKGNVKIPICELTA